MVYEYSKEIQESGIDRSIASSNLTSYYEMGLAITLEAIKNTNKIFEQAGIIEFDKYNKGTLTEANAKELGKAVIGKIKKGLMMAWEKIKGVFEAIRDFFNRKIDEFKSKIGNKFNKLNLGDYKDILEKKFNSEKLIDIADNDKIYQFEIDVTAVYNKATAELEKMVRSSEVPAISYQNSYGLLVAGVANNKKVDLNDRIGADITKAQEIINQEVAYDNGKLNANWIIEKKDDIYKYITGASVGTINESYKKAKKAIDDANKQFSAYEKAGMINIKEAARAELNLTLAYGNILLYLNDLRKKNLVKYIVLAARCVAVCKPKKEEVKQESVKLKYDTDFVNECFNW